jgi:hypothetical protein
MLELWEMKELILKYTIDCSGFTSSRETENVERMAERLGSR